MSYCATPDSSGDTACKSNNQPKLASGVVEYIDGRIDANFPSCITALGEPEPEPEPEPDPGQIFFDRFENAALLGVNFWNIFK